MQIRICKYPSLTVQSYSEIYPTILNGIYFQVSEYRIADFRSSTVTLLQPLWASLGPWCDIEVSKLNSYLPTLPWHDPQWTADCPQLNSWCESKEDWRGGYQVRKRRACCHQNYPLSSPGSPSQTTQDPPLFHTSTDLLVAVWYNCLEGHSHLHETMYPGHCSPYNDGMMFVPLLPRSFGSQNLSALGNNPMPCCLETSPKEQPKKGQLHVGLETPCGIEIHVGLISCCNHRTVLVCAILGILRSVAWIQVHSADKCYPYLFRNKAH